VLYADDLSPAGDEPGVAGAEAGGDDG